MRSSCLPTVVATTLPLSCQRSKHFSTKLSAHIYKPRSVSTNAYTSSGLRLSAWFAGMVHAVVVQMTAKASLLSFGKPKAAASFSGWAHRKATSKVSLFLSAYSISNSAKDEPQSKHQYTGFKPRYTKPRSITRLKARISPASLPKSMVR